MSSLTIFPPVLFIEAETVPLRLEAFVCERLA